MIKIHKAKDHRILPKHFNFLFFVCVCHHNVPSNQRNNGKDLSAENDIVTESSNCWQGIPPFSFLPTLDTCCLIPAPLLCLIDF